MNNENFNEVAYKMLTQHCELPYWVEIINDLVEGAGYSYSRIAHRINVSPSTIQKLATNHSRKPRHVVFHRLLVLYYKIFFGPYRTTQAEAYIHLKEMRSKERIVRLNAQPE